MDKKVTAIRLSPQVHRRLRMLSAENGLPIGDAIERLIAFAEGGKLIPDAILREWFSARLAKALSAPPGRNGLPSRANEVE